MSKLHSESSDMIDNVQYTPVDCRSSTGITIGLIDTIINNLYLLVKQDLSAPQIKEALADLVDTKELWQILDLEAFDHTYNAMAQEYKHAKGKHTDYPTLHHALAVVREEYLEVEELAFKQSVNLPQLKKELLHLIVTAVRTLEYIESVQNEK